jgi:hypothetical protein
MLETRKQIDQYMENIENTFEAEGKKVAQALPAEIDGQVRKALEETKQAVADRKPVWFSPTSAVASNLIALRSSQNCWRLSLRARPRRIPRRSQTLASNCRRG